jgi:hypothetical protein
MYMYVFFTSENVDEKKIKEDPDLSEKVIEITETNEDKSRCKFCAKCFQLHVWQNLAYICEILNSNLRGFQNFVENNMYHISYATSIRGRHGHDRMVIGFITTYAISSAYHH